MYLSDLELILLCLDLLNQHCSDCFAVSLQLNTQGSNSFLRAQFKHLHTLSRCSFCQLFILTWCVLIMIISGLLIVTPGDKYDWIVSFQMLKHFWFTLSDCVDKPLNYVFIYL